MDSTYLSQVLSHRKRKKRDCLEFSDEFLRSGSVVHGFVSKRHPTGAPPTLRITLLP
jgi:hypothetical protein